MDDIDTSDNAALLFLLTTEAGSENYSPEARALATIVGFKMWWEALHRCYAWHEENKPHDKG